MSLYDIRYRTKGRVVCDNKRDVTGLACGNLTEFKCFVACDCMVPLDFFSEKRQDKTRQLYFTRVAQSAARLVSLEALGSIKLTYTHLQ